MAEPMVPGLLSFNHLPQGDDVGHRLRAGVSYRDGHSTDGNDRKMATSDPSAAVEGGLALSGPAQPVVAEVVVPETAPRVVAPYTATAPEGATITWSLAGPDRNKAEAIRSGFLSATLVHDTKVSAGSAGSLSANRGYY